MWFITFSVCVFLLTFDLSTSAGDQNCFCVTGSTKVIYTSPEVTREEIGLAIRGECLPVAHTNDENESWVAVDFKKNIIFHQLHIVGYIMRDSGTVHRRCTGGQNIAFLTTDAPVITYSPTTEVTTTEEFITSTMTGSSYDSTPVTMETTLISTLKPTSDITSDRTPTISSETNVMSTMAGPITKGTSTDPGSTTESPITNLLSSTSLPLTLSTTAKQNKPTTTTDFTTMSRSTTTVTPPTDSYTTSNSFTTKDTFISPSVTKTTDLPLTSDVTKATAATSSAPSSTSDRVELTTVALPATTMIFANNTTDKSCDLVCLNGGTCVTDPFTTCLCNGGWSGTSCDVCADTTCYHGDCVTIGTTPRCVCKPGYTGVSCNESHVCNGTDVSIGGKCYSFNFVYETCQENYCQNQPGTECLVNSEGVYCLCSDEFNPKDSTPCGCPSGQVKHLNGTCVEIDCRGVSSCSHGSCYFRSFYNFGCLCDEGWEGEECDMAIIQCGAHRCNNNGTCVRDPDAMCHCADAWTGTECDLCGQQLCHHGVCILDRYQQPICVCDKEYSGPNCDQVVPCSGQQFGGHCYGNDLENFTPCVENVCMTGQLCVAAIHTFKNDLYCVCKENVTEAYLTQDCGCPERSLRNYRGECVDIVL